tara:strand:- start:1350 stop:2126 length:777 start_codon:yes stop_codon:yes gene_type:complete
MGYVAYEGESRIDSKPIVVIVTGVGTRKSDRSKNEKTGELAQVWYLRSDISPLAAISSGEDKSICGDCKLRGHVEQTKKGPRNRMRSCYVEIQNAPRSIYQSYRDGNYEPLTDDIQWPTQKTRLGAYGDPSVAPFAVNKDLVSRGNGKQTGYTHQHADRRFAPMRKMVMASVHSEEEAVKLQSQGWRTFRTMSEGDELMPNELMCPASEAEGKRLTCEECMACSGIGLNKSRQNAMSVAIFAHGSPSKMSSYNKTFDV